MAGNEKWGFRNAAYSRWHRPDSIGRFITEEDARALAQVDIDEILTAGVALYDDESTIWLENVYMKWPRALIETAFDNGRQDNKDVAVLYNLAERSKLPAVLTLYKTSDVPNPFEPDIPDIASFRARRVWPETEYEFRAFTPSEYANWLIRIREYGQRDLTQFLRDKCLLEQNKEMSKFLEETIEQKRALRQRITQRDDQIMELMLAIEAERKKARKKTDARSELRLPLFPIEEPPF